MTKVNLDQLDVTVAMIKGNLKALQLLSSDEQLAAVETSEDFEDLTANLKFSDITSKLQDYLGALATMQEKLAQNDGHLEPPTPSIGQQVKQRYVDPDFESALSDIFGGFNVFG